jgi:hypothetical protein
MLWDDEAVYFVARLQEENVWASITERDTVIYDDNDFEVFLDVDARGDKYYELEVNALNTVWDMFHPKEYHRRSCLVTAYDIDGLQTRGCSIRPSTGRPVVNPVRAAKIGSGTRRTAATFTFRRRGVESISVCCGQMRRTNRSRVLLRRPSCPDPRRWLGTWMTWSGSSPARSPSGQILQMVKPAQRRR